MNHGILLGILKKYVADEDVFWLLENIVDSFSTPSHFKTVSYVIARSSCDEAIHNVGQRPWIASPAKARNDVSNVCVKGTGLPLGNVTSQIFINIYLNELDQFVKRILKMKHYIRYADDFVILHEDRQILEQLIQQISDFVATELHMSLHPQKLFLQTVASGIDFLGWVHFPHHHRVLRTSTKKRMMKKLSQNVSKGTVASYRGMLGHGDTYKLHERMDKIISS